MTAVSMAHQRLIRQQELGGLWDTAVTSLTGARTERISSELAATIILRYEWLGSMPRVVRDCWGLWFGDRLGGALVFAEKPGANLASNDNGPVPRDAFYLARGACAHWTPKNSASWFIAAVCRQLGDVSVLAYADPSAGEIGQIYRALNWYYLGPSAGGPHGWLVNGELWGTRRVGRAFGEQSVEVLRRHFPGAVIITVPRKHRFVGVYGSRRYRRALASRLIKYVVPYRLHR